MALPEESVVGGSAYSDNHYLTVVLAETPTTAIVTVVLKTSAREANKRKCIAHGFSRGKTMVVG